MWSQNDFNFSSLDQLSVEDSSWNEKEILLNVESFTENEKCLTKYDEQEQTLMTVLRRKRSILFFASFASLLIGASWSSYGLLIGLSLKSLTQPDKEYVLDKSKFFSFCFLMLSILAGLSNFAQK